MLEDFIGLIPAAGKGVRLGLPYPKELYPIIRDNRYKPVSQYVVENLTAAGAKHIVFIINETKHQLIGYFGDGSRFNCRFSYVVQEQRENDALSRSPGLAHALNAAQHLIAHKTVCFGMPDTILNPSDVFTQISAAMQPKDDLALGLFPVTRPEKIGVVVYDTTGRVERIIDKPRKTEYPHGWACMIWRPRFTEFLAQSLNQGVYDFAEVMNAAINQGIRLRGVVIRQGSFVDLGTYEDIEELEQRYRA